MLPSFCVASIASCTWNYKRSMIRCSSTAVAAAAAHGNSKSNNIGMNNNDNNVARNRNFSDTYIDKVGYITDIEGDRQFWWKYVKMSKILEIAPSTVDNSDEKFDVLLKNDCHLVFGGDVNDHYDGDIEVVEELLKLKNRYPDRVHFILGNRDINKLRITQELSDQHVKKYEWDETYPGTFWTKIFFKDLTPFEQVRSKGITFVSSKYERLDRLKWILSCTMGSPNSFVNRYHELRRRNNKSGYNTTYDQVVDNYINNVKPNGIFAEYMEHAKLALIIKDTLFVHGAICARSYGWFPHSKLSQNRGVDAGCTDGTPNDIARVKETNVNEWVHKLNTFAKKGIYDCIHNKQASEPWSFTGSYDRHNPCNNILQYGMGWLPNGKRNPTIVYNQWVVENKNALNSINFPIKEITDNLKSSGVKRILTGHKPLGDSPEIFSDRDQSFHIISADTSYSARTQYLNDLSENTIEAFEKIKQIDEQHAKYMKDNKSGPPYDISNLRHICRRGHAVAEVIIDFSNNDDDNGKNQQEGNVDYNKSNNNNDGSVYIHGILATGDAFEANLNSEPLIGKQTVGGKFVKGMRLKDNKFIISHSKGWNCYNEFFSREEVEKML
jgi:hypothetical protein